MTVWRGNRTAEHGRLPFPVYSTPSETSEEEVGKRPTARYGFKSRGLPLRHEFDLDAGDGHKKHHSSRYEYRNVQPPPL
jgi:hypothetical protein